VIALEPELLLDGYGTNVVGRDAVRGALERKLAYLAEVRHVAPTHAPSVCESHIDGSDLSRGEGRLSMLTAADLLAQPSRAVVPR
jgi:hypothetical protein